MTRALIIAIACLLALMLATIEAARPAYANPNCADRAFVLTQLAQKYGETRRGMGLAANSTVMELFASAENGTWTVTVTMPDGMTCLVASGDRFESLKEDLPPGGIPG